MTLEGDGTGQLILGGTNSFTGGTYIDPGTLIVNNSSAIPDGTSLTVGAGGVFIFDPMVYVGSSVESSPAHAAGGVAAVPEPGTIILLAAGLVAGFVVWRRGKSRGRVEY